MSGFTIIDNKTGNYPDCENIALNEEWAKHLCYCDIDTFAVTEDGSLILMDDCGKCAYCPEGRFTIAADNNVGHKWIPVSERLPKEGEEVIVFGYWHEKFQPLMCYLSPHRKGGWFTTVAGQQVYTVTHLDATAPTAERRMIMGKNDFLARQQATYQGILDTGEQMGMQKMWDYIQLTLRDPDVMGKDTFGKERIEKVFENVKFLADRYHICFTDDKEADYYQEEMDALLRKGCDEFYTFYERYPQLKKLGYKKSRKGWV